MKKTLLVILSTLLLSANVFSVEKEQVKLGKAIKFSSCCQLGDGYLFPLVPYVATKTLFDCRSTNLQQKWEFELPEYSAKSIYMIPSNDFQKTYYKQELNFKSGKVIFNQISTDGKVKTLELKEKDFDKGATKSVFCTDNYLFTLTVNKENKKDTYRLHRFDHKTFTHKSILLNLPQDDKHVEYMYASYSGDNIFLIAKSDNKKSYSTLIVELDENGTLVNQLNISPDLGGEEVFGISKNQNLGKLKFGIIYTNRFTKYAYIDYVDNASKKVNPVSKYSQKGDVVIEKASNAIYFYGYTEDKNLYIHKYDLKGNFVWKYKQAVKEMSSGIHLEAKDKVVFHELGMKITLDENGKVIEKKNYNFNIENSYSYPTTLEFAMLHNEADRNPELKSFMESKEAKQQEEIKVWETKSELILVCKKKSGSGMNPKKLDIYRFKK